CGWVLGPPKDRALFDNTLPKEMPMSCINRNVGFAPVETGFARVEGRPAWAIPWLEDDPALLVPQLWVGRMRRDAADALACGCTGLLGIHWRTRILGPNVSALAKAAWGQEPWNSYLGKKIEIPDLKMAEGREGGNVAAFSDNTIADTERGVLYQTVTYDMKAYRLKMPNGAYTVRLQFCEPHYAEAGKRVFGVMLQGRKAIDKLDIFATVGKNRALDYCFPGVEVSNGILEIQFDSIVEFPCIAALAVEGNGVARRVNCGGPALAGYEADLPQTNADNRPRDLPAEDFYVDWAKAEFGPEAAEPVAKIFAKLDGGPDMGIGKRRDGYLPRPSTWVDGPGGIQPDSRLWDQVKGEYAFVDDLAGLRSKIRDPGNLERFDYWLNPVLTIGSTPCSISGRWGRSTAPGAGSTRRWAKSRRSRIRTSRSNWRARSCCRSARSWLGRWPKPTRFCSRVSRQPVGWAPWPTGSSICCRICWPGRAKSWPTFWARRCPPTPCRRTRMMVRRG
ncbi:MAG: malectin, partial [Planctomycetes bacterium]|nr:malectin [Planctomycetota bacterium]